MIPGLRPFVFVMMLFCALASSSLPAQPGMPLTLLVHPDYPPDQARLVYQPLVDYLRTKTPLQIELDVDRNFHRYWLNARRGEAPQLILEHGHMVAWRMENQGFRPLVTTNAQRTFSLLTSGARADDPLSAFVGRRIASLPSPSLGYLVLADWFPNPLQQPIIQSSATSWLDAVEMVFSAEADGAIAPDNLVDRYPNLYAVATSDAFPGLSLNASPEVSEETAQQLIDALVELHEDAEYHGVLFELDIERFVPADPGQFEGLEALLSGLFQL